MKSISYSAYFDKVYGCFLGKCVGGTAGGPAEGRKELLDYPLEESILHTALPNDDLDLQILWLEVMEDRGLSFTAQDLAQSFYNNVPYGPGEYAYFKKSFGRGIQPPVTGWFNNRFYKNGMGCPIRSEIWACICPGEPERTWKYVEMDGTLDHASDSVWAEYFLAAAESMAFFQDGTDALLPLLHDALALLPADAKITQALADTIRLYEAGKGWKFIRSYVIRHYGHPDCTNLYQNMCFTLLALLFGGGDMRETIRLGCAMGYDTDCICATAASLIGILRGADVLLGEDGFTDTGIRAAVKLRRSDCSIKDLARDVTVAGLSLLSAYPGDVRITDAPEYTPIPANPTQTPPLAFSVDYRGDPVLCADREKTVILHLTAGDAPFRGSLTVDTPDGILCALPYSVLRLDAGESMSVPMSFVIAPNAHHLAQKNSICVRVTAGDGTVYPYCFGLNGADVWYCYGPFFRNNRDLSHISPYVPYGPHMDIPAGEPWEDTVRDYHLNRFADLDDNDMDPAVFFTVEDGTLPKDPEDARRMPEEVSITEDYFEAGDLYTSEGPAVSYLFRYLTSPEDREVDVTVGCEGPFRLWINGSLIGASQTVGAWTLENRHYYRIPFRKGQNRILLQIANLTGRAAFSLIYRIPGASWRQYEDFGSVLIRSKDC